MSSVIVTAPVLTGVSAAHRGAASVLSARADAEAVGTGALAPTFGLIGMEFLGALGEVLGERQQRLRSLADRRDSLGTATDAARDHYLASDAAGGRAVTV